MRGTPIVLNFVFSWLSFFTLTAQKYDIVNFSIEQGLVQSQLNNLAIDKNGFLWASTLGGISRFDGKEFKNFNYSSGLSHSIADYVFVDNSNSVWVSTSRNIQIWNGRIFKNVQVDSAGHSLSALYIDQANNGEIYALGKNLNLYKYNSNKNELYKVSLGNDLITCFTIDQDKLIAAVFRKGIYVYEMGNWHPYVLFPSNDSLLQIRQLVKDTDEGTWIGVNPNSLLKIQKNQILRLPVTTDAYFTGILPYQKNEYYVATTKGAIKWDRLSNKIEILRSAQGLTDNVIHDMISDEEKNIWFASDGNGIYRMRPNSNLVYDVSTGLSGNVVMSIVESKEKEIYVGSLEHGLSLINEAGQAITLNEPGKMGKNVKINSSTNSYDGSLWIGTIGSGLWNLSKSKNGYQSVQLFGESQNVISLYEHTDSALWIGTPRGLLRYKNKSLKKIKGINNGCFAIAPYINDSILIGTGAGLRVVHENADSGGFFFLSDLNKFLVGAIKNYDTYLAFGTSENGIYLWNKDYRNSKLINCNESNGLSSNMIFSLLEDNGFLYTGTINGLNKIKYIAGNDSFDVQHLKTSQKLGPECNQNAMYKDRAGNIWVGTTKGLYVYKSIHNNYSTPPSVFLKSIDIFSAPLDSQQVMMSTDTAAALPVLHLGYKQNHISFHLQGLHLSAADDIQYQYYLSGTSEIFSKPQTQSTVIYPNLPPGQYVFKAKAVLVSAPHLESKTLSYSFVIDGPFYQKSWFRFSIVVSLLLLGSFIQKYRMHLKASRLKLVDEVRRQEQIKIQQRTSEDLHDDLGNKITRLSLLTDILETKVSPNTEQQKLITQIKENIQGLYLGTKDIIWALAPAKHTLRDTLDRIQNFGMELFQESEIKFKMNVSDDAYVFIKPPFEFSRNLIMICKEALHNVLKHANAHQVSLKFEKIQEQRQENLVVEIMDDGTGFSMDQIRRGNGLENMQKRADRIGGKLEINTNDKKGTIIRFTVKIPQSEG